MALAQWHQGGIGGDSGGTLINSNANRWQKFGHGAPFSNNAVENQALVLMRTPGTWSRISLKVQVNTRDGVTTGKSRVNGADGNQFIGVPAATTGIFTDTTHTDTVAAGDDINYQIFSIHSINVSIGFSCLGWASNYEATGDDAVYRIVNIANSNNIGAGADGEFMPSMAGEQTIPSGEETIQQVIPVLGGSIKNLWVNISAGLGGTTTSITLRVNGQSSPLVLTFPNATSGDFEETDTTVEVEGGDLVNYLINSDATIEFARALGHDFFTEDFWGGGSRDGAGVTLIGSTVDNRLNGFGMLTGFHTQSTAETDSEMEVGRSYTWAGLVFYINTNLQTAPCSWHGRVNGVDTNWVGTVPSLSSGQFTTVGDPATVVASDLVCIRRNSVLAGGAVALTYFTHNLLGGPAAVVEPPFVPVVSRNLIMRRQRTMPHINDELAWIYYLMCHLDMETGTALLDPTAQGHNPQVMLDWSDDHGNTWSHEKWATAGKTADWDLRVLWRRLGRSRDRVFRVTISEPIKVALVDFYMNAEKGTS